MRFITALFLIGLVVSGALADESDYFPDFPEGFRCDHFNYDKERGIIDTSGSVEVTVAGGLVHSDHFRVDLKRRLATAEGNVRFSSDDYTVGTDWLLYNISTETVSLPNIRAQYYPLDLQGKIYFSANDISLSQKHVHSGVGTLTTCGDRYPHYHVSTGSVDYHKGESFAGGNATIYVGDMPVFWVPLLTFNFARTDKRDLEIGNNQVEGNYAKSSWGFAHGRLILNYLANKGIGYGSEIESTPAKLYLYHLNERDTGASDWTEKLELKKEITPQTKMDLSQSYLSSYQIPAGRLDQTLVACDLSDAGSSEAWKMSLNGLTDRVVQTESYSALFDRHMEEHTTDGYYNYEYSLGDIRWMRTAARYNNSLPLIANRIYLSTDLEYYRNQDRLGDPGQERVAPQLELTGTEPNYSWRLTRNWLVDLRPDLSSGTDQYEFLEKQPEVEVKGNPIDLNLFILQPTIGFGSYREAHFVAGSGAIRDFSAQRYRGSCDFFKPFSLGFGTDVLLGVGVDQYLYSSRDKLYAYREAATIQNDIGLFFRNTISYRKGYTRGNSPFFFDRLETDFHDIYDKMVFYHLDKFAWSLEGGRNWQTGKWFDLMSRLLVSPSEKFNWSVDSGWDVENHRYKDLSSSVTLFPVSYFSAEASVINDPNSGAFKSASSSYRLTLLENEPNQLFIQVDQGYDPSDNELRVRDIMLVKDLHCWQMKYTYSDYLKQFSITFTLKAMPGEQFGSTESLLQGYTR